MFTNSYQEIVWSEDFKFLNITDERNHILFMIAKSIINEIDINLSELAFGINNDDFLICFAETKYKPISGCCSSAIGLFLRKGEEGWAVCTNKYCRNKELFCFKLTLSEAEELWCNSVEIL